MSYSDQIFRCRDCQSPFVFTVWEQTSFAERGFHPPTRCKGCRQARKAQQEAPGNPGKDEKQRQG